MYPATIFEHEALLCIFPGKHDWPDIVNGTCGSDDSSSNENFNFNLSKNRHHCIRNSRKDTHG